MANFINERNSERVSSFYGIHGNTQVQMKPKLSISAPGNSLYGEHVSFKGANLQEFPQKEDESIFDVLYEHF